METPMQTDNDMISFLAARMLLPDPDQCNKMFYLISVGNQQLALKVDYHLQTELPVRAFLFERCRTANHAKAYHWVCTNARLQQIIYENNLFASELLSDIHL